MLVAELQMAMQEKTGETCVPTRIGDLGSWVHLQRNRTKVERPALSKEEENQVRLLHHVLLM